MKKCFLFLGISAFIIALPLPSLAERWVIIRNLSSNRQEAIDLDSVRKEGDRIFFWKILTSNNSNYRSGNLSYFVLNCQARTYKTLKIALRENGQNIQEVDLSRTSQTLPIQNYSLMVVAHRRFCTNSNLRSINPYSFHISALFPPFSFS